MLEYMLRYANWMAMLENISFCQVTRLDDNVRKYQFSSGYKTEW